MTKSRQLGWLLEIDGIESYHIKMAQRPFFILKSGKMKVENMHLTFYDFRKDSILQSIYDWMKNKDKKNATLSIISRRAVIEQWSFEDLQVVFVSFGNLEYKQISSLNIECEVSCKNATLDFRK